jgi:hypothetical protein
MSHYNSRIHIGDREYSAGRQYFDGKVDDVRIYNRALSESEVVALYSQANTGTFTDPQNDEDVIEWIPEMGRYLNRTAEKWVDDSRSNIESTLISDQEFAGIVEPPVVYQVDWDGPPHTLNQKTATGGAHAPSRINYGEPTVVSSFGQLTMRPLELINTDTQTFSYSQIRFSLNSAVKKYVLEFDVQKSEADQLTILFDTNDGVRNFHLNSSITGYRLSLPTISWNPAVKNRVRLIVDLATLTCEVTVNNNPPVSGTISPGATSHGAVRISCNDQGVDGGVAIDNLTISTEPIIPPIPPWYDVTPSSGTVPPGSNLSVAVTFDATDLVAGDYSNVTLNVVCNDAFFPSNSVPASMWVLPPAPTIVVEPAFTPGTSNEVAWGSVEGPVSYLAEVVTDTNSIPLQQSGWVAATNHLFNSLITNVVYYYHVKASTAGGDGLLESAWSDWVQSKQVAGLDDLDSDLVADWWERLYFGHETNCYAWVDSDGDGQLNIDEYIAGMDPTSSNSYFRVRSLDTLTNGGFVLNWDTVTGRVYSVNWNTNLLGSFHILESGMRHPQNTYTDDVHNVEEYGFYVIDVQLDSGDPSGASNLPPAP